MKYSFLTSLGKQFPVAMLCKVMRISKSAYYAWRKRPAIIISALTLNLHRREKAIFEDNQDSLGIRELGKKRRKEDFDVSRHRVIGLMKRLGLVIKQRIAYNVTTKRKHSDAVADNLLNMNFNPLGPNQVWPGDLSYLKTGEG
jgi:putative transposase